MKIKRMQYSIWTHDGSIVYKPMKAELHMNPLGLYRIQTNECSTVYTVKTLRQAGRGFLPLVLATTTATLQLT